MPHSLADQKRFMDRAQQESNSSVDRETKVGACLVSADGDVLGVGYNGMPNVREGVVKDKEYPWTKPEPNEDPLKDKLLYVCHAELNALVDAIKQGHADKLQGCTIYVTHFPCNECAKLIVQFRLKEVVYRCDKMLREQNKKYVAAKKIFDYSEVIDNKYTGHKNY